MTEKKNLLKTIGPGIVVAATGIGAGDMIAAAVAGAKFSYVLLWAAVVGAVLKFILNEGIARWQLVNGSTLTEAWIRKMNSWVSLYFLVYLFLWSFVVGGALIAACGLAAHAVFPFLGLEAWGIIHSLLAVILVLAGHYHLLEKMMKFFIALMFVVVIVNAVLIVPDPLAIFSGLFIPVVPIGAGKFILGIIGGVGGSVTLLSYGYWIREKSWYGSGYLKTARLDLAIAYLLTAAFGIAIMIIAAEIKPEVITGSKMVLNLALQLEETTGSFGKWIFLVGFWGAVFSSMLGVWQGVPYLFTDFINNYKGKEPGANPGIITKSPYYRWFLFYIALMPVILLFTGKAVWIIILYSVAGAFFMPFLAITLLYLLNYKKWMGTFASNWFYNTLLILILLIFVYLSLTEILEMLA